MSQEKRTFLAIALMLGVLLVYQTLVFKPPPEPERAPTPAPEATAAKPVGRAAPPSAPAPPTARAERKPSAPPRLATVETPFYRAVVSSEGGKLQELTLKYRGEKPLVIVGELGSAGLLVDGAALSMRLSGEGLALDRRQPTGELALEGEDGGLRIGQTLAFDAASYTMEVRLHVENRGQSAREVTLAVAWITRQDWRDARSQEKFPGQLPSEIVWLEDGQIRRIDNLCEIAPVTTRGGWIAADSTWYTAALIPRAEGFTLTAAAEDPKACETKGKDPVGRATVAAQAAPSIPAGASWEGRVLVYAGPKEYDRLRALGLEGAINFGGFPVPRRWGGLPMEWFGVPILLLMNWVYRYVGNYGVAIILLTIVTRVLFYPLTVKSMKSMKAMQALQPQINALRSRYKNDAQRLQRETMELYRANKVNPLGGCLPMVAQVPIFYALYLALSVSVELQNAAFLCFGRVFGVDVWICDLATHDPTYVLPVLMGVTMFIQQKMTPMGGDPRQAKIMLIVMPIFLTAMFINLPSGLVLYWTVSNVLQILQQKYMNLTLLPFRGARA